MSLAQLFSLKEYFGKIHRELKMEDFKDDDSGEIPVVQGHITQPLFVNVPIGFNGGDEMYIRTGQGKFMKVRIPPHCSSGSSFLIRVYDNDTYEYIETASMRQTQTRITQRRIEAALSYVWLVLSLLVTSLIISSFSVSSFCEQHISLGCDASNPFSGEPVTKMYYILAQGFCSSDSNDDSDSSSFCIKFSDMNTWERIDGAITSSNNANAINVKSNMATDAEHAWKAVEVMLPIAFIMSFCAVIFIGWGIKQDTSVQGNFKNVFLIGSSSFWLILCWAIAISAYNTVWFSDSMTPYIWQRLYLTGTSFGELISDGNQSPTSPDSSCFVSISFGAYDGILFLAIAMPISFFLSLWILCTRCCGSYDEYVAFSVGQP